MPEIAQYQNYIALEKKLWRTNDHWRIFRILEGLARFAAILAGTFFFFALLEGIIHFSSTVRLGMILVLVAELVAGAAFYIFKPILESTTIEQVARHIENKFPQLNNGLINAVLLARDEKIPEPYFLERMMDEVGSLSQKFDFNSSVDKRKFANMALSCLLCVLFLMGYVLFFPERFSNAVARIVKPYANIEAVGSVVIKEVLPGDTEIVSGSNLTVQAVVPRAPISDISARLFYRFKDNQQKEEIRTLRRTAADKYSATIPEVKIPLTYYVRIENSTSRQYKVEVLARPLITRIDLSYKYPEYTRLEPVTVENSDGNIRAPVGTEVTINAWTNRPIAASSLILNDTEEKRVSIELDQRRINSKLYIKENATYYIQVADDRGYVNSNPIKHIIEAVSDSPPSIEIPSPGKEETLAPSDALDMVIKVADDYAVGNVTLYARINQSEASVVNSWSEFNDRRSTLLYKYSIPAKDVKNGDEITYWATATDTCAIPGPQTSESQKYVIKIMDIEKIKEEKAQDIDRWTQKLEEILKLQKKARTASRELRNKLTKESLRGAVGAIRPDQIEVRAETIKLADDMESGSPLVQKIRSILLKLSLNEMASCIKTLEDLQRLDDLLYREEPLGRLTKNQDTIIQILEAILKYMPKLKEKILNPQEEEDAFDLPNDVMDELSNLEKDLQKFLDTQKKVIEASKDLLKLPVDDWTEEDEKKLEELRVKEDDLAKLLKEDYSDFSRIPEQDFSDPAMLRELIELISEIEKASDALTRRNIELAVPHEQLGAELAESLTTHIEKWLPDSADRERWTQEEPWEQYETPLAELPEQLEDLIGELMEEEDELFDEIEDVTSSWADSIDKGAGWDALDGPISNMSAQGVTGNRLPNSQEIGGRSGEGRTGKAHGEMVGDTAIGKGGRKTPSRLTPDPFQKGHVKDQTPDSGGGATGGGKQSGAGSEGLEGMGPRIMRDYGRLKGMQASLRNKAERVNASLKVQGYPNESFEKAIKVMKNVEEDLTDLSSGIYRTPLRRREILIESLTDTQRILKGEARIISGGTQSLPDFLMDEIRNSMDDPAPKGYEDLLQAYYKRLSTAKSVK